MIQTEESEVKTMGRIGLAVTKEEFELITKKTYDSSGAYHIIDWDNLESLRDGTSVILFSKEWFLEQRISAADNLPSFYKHYRRFGIRVYYLDFYFNPNDSDNINELSGIIENDFYNILIGDGYILSDIAIKTARDLARKDWVNWLEKLHKKQATPEDVSSWLKKDEEEPVDFKKFFEQRRERMAPFWVRWLKELERKAGVPEASGELSKHKNKIRVRDKRQEAKEDAPQSDEDNYHPTSYFNQTSAQKRKEDERFSWALLKKFYLKGLICMFIGTILGVIAIKPLIEMGLSNRASIDEWETIKNQQEEALVPDETPTLDDSKGGMQKGDFIGLIKLPNKSNAVGVRLGTSDDILNKGAGLDETSAEKLGQRGNAVVYGHREEVFWELKDIKKGDIITVETLDGEFKYEVKNTRITTPNDESIYQYSRKHLLTLVTCYPFVYMGATPERFVVEAELIEAEVSETN